MMKVRSAPTLATLVVLAVGCSGPGPGDVTDGPVVDAADPAIDAAIDAATDAALDAAEPPTPVPFSVELGHVTGVVSVQRTASRALSVDAGGHWALWDLGTRALVAKGDRACPVGQACQQPAALLAGDTVLVRGMPDLETRSATTGAVLATIPSQAGLDTPGSGLADDGSYVWAATTTSLRAWAPSGAPRVNVPGNYLASRVFAAASELRIGAGPAGAGRIERFAVPTGVRTTSLHDGVFARWFGDGARFLTTSSNLVRVYDAAGASVSAAVLPHLMGLDARGDRLWIRTRQNFDEALTVYRASDLTAAPTLIAIPLDAELVDSPGAIGALHQTYGSLDSIDLTTLAVTHVAGLPCGLGAFSGGGSSWMVGTSGGAVLTGTGGAVDHPLARGRLTSASGTVGGLAAVASAAGIVELVEVDDTPMVVRTLPLLSTHVELSTDGATLLASEYLVNGSCRPALPLRLISTATGAVLHEWPYAGAGDTTLLEVSFARTARLQAHYTVTGGAFVRTLTGADGATLPGYGPPITSDIFNGISGLLLFAPGGARAASLGAYVSADQAFTYLYAGGVQRAIVDGFPLGWLDDDRVLIARYTRAGNQDVLASTTVRAVDGTVVATPALPDLFIAASSTTARLRGHVTPAGEGQLYARRKNAVYAEATGALVWAGPVNQSAEAVSDVAGDHVLYVAGTTVQLVRFRP